MTEPSSPDTEQRTFTLENGGRALVDNARRQTIAFLEYHNGTPEIVEHILKAANSAFVDPTAQSSAVSADDFEALREVEEAWLASEIGRAIANLAYPVGCGSAPMDYHLQSAAKALFNRYAKMIKMARGMNDPAQGKQQPTNCDNCGAAFKPDDDVFASLNHGVRRTVHLKCPALAKPVPEPEVIRLQKAMETAKVLIGAINDRATPAVRESNINMAWHILDDNLKASTLSSTESK